MPLIEDDFPDFYHRADAHSGRWQARYLWSERIQLGALLAAAGVAAVGGPPFPVVLLLGVALVAQAFRLASHADEKWWNGRAGAESAKTASWLFVVGGEPFDTANPQADVELASRIAEVAREVARLVPVPAADTHVTTGMRSLRDRPLDERVEVYQRERIRGQRDWYATKSEFNEKRSTAWSSAAIVASGLALGFGIAALLTPMWITQPPSRPLARGGA